MRDIAKRFAYARLGAAVAVVATATVAIAPAQAGAATPAKPPTISTQWTPNQIGVGQTSGVTYTITNPNASGSLYQISFTDTLPSTSTIDNPAGVTNSGCGSAVAITATPATATVYASGITVKAGTPCTISVAIDGNTPGTASDVYSTVLYTSSSASYAMAVPVPVADQTPAALQVIGAPTIATKTPKSGAVYAYGAVVKASYSCAAAAGDDPTQLTCTGVDDLGNSINSGQKLDTKVAGKHELDIEAISGITGDTTEVAVDYTVQPDNVFTISKVKAGKGGALGFKLSLPGAGKVAVKEVAGKKVLHTKSLTVNGEKTVSVALATVPAAAKATLEVTYTPKGGVKRTLTKRGIKLS